MAFRFSLAAVLMVRGYAEQREERALRAIQLQVSALRQQIEDLDAVIAALHDAGVRSMHEPIPAFKLQQILRQAEQAKKTREAVQARLNTLLQELARQTKVYQAAHRDREALTSMEQEQREVYEREQARAQQKQLDDIFMARRHRSD